MAKKILFAALLLVSISGKAQTNPAITSWLQNTTITGTYYMQGNSTAQPNNILVNCQLIEYSPDYVYVHTRGIPAYPTGPFIGNPSVASDQNAIFKMPLNPVQNTGNAIATNGGNIGIFINGVALFDYRDGVAWNATTNALCGGPGNPPCPGGMDAVQDWSRDAIPAEMPGDCSKAHPAMGNYHHHQNPSAFKLDLNVISTICNLYDADGLYAIDENEHSPLIGFAYDGFPIYGAYGYASADGSGGIVRIKSGYQLRNITERNTAPDGTSVSNGAPINDTYPLGYFREDYEFIEHPGQPDYLDEHNGRFCITPEYPEGIYCYFATVDENWNSAYPYVVGPTFYGVAANRLVTSVSEATTTYVSADISNITTDDIRLNIFPNPTNDFIAIQLTGLNKENLNVELYDASGKLVQASTIKAGATNTYLDVRTVYAGNYLVKISGKGVSTTQQVVISK
jgi:YHYH protein/Secretion system C-terminal sorting domain